MAEFKDRLRGIRSEHRITQKQLASRVGVSTKTIWNWENGIGYPVLSDAVIIADTFGCTLDQLAGRT